MNSEYGIYVRSVSQLSSAKGVRNTAEEGGFAGTRLAHDHQTIMNQCLL